MENDSRPHLHYPSNGNPVVITTIIMQNHEKLSLDHYAEGATLAEEVVSMVRVAQAFGTQERLVDKYDTYLIKAEKSGAVKSIVIAIQMFTVFFVIYVAEGLVFWYGARLLANGTITNSGTVFTYTIPATSSSDLQCVLLGLDRILFRGRNCSQSSSVHSCLECLLQDLQDHRSCSPDRRLL
jgi:ABC-type bacteriocin/lantibiotic exporter with double-glycine peptidase domain